eukprot:9195247-Alexandrium_andersonii.AAC.1
MLHARSGKPQYVSVTPLPSDSQAVPPLPSSQAGLRPPTALRSRRAPVPACCALIHGLHLAFGEAMVP